MKELLYLKDEQLKDLIEKLFVSYRETFSDSKKVLERYSYLWPFTMTVSPDEDRTSGLPFFTLQEYGPPT